MHEICLNAVSQCALVLDNVCFSRSPSLGVNKPVLIPLPSSWGQKALLFEFHLSRHIGELVTTNETGGSPLPKHLSLVLILQHRFSWNYLHNRLKSPKINVIIIIFMNLLYHLSIHAEVSL